MNSESKNIIVNEGSIKVAIEVTEKSKQAANLLNEMLKRDDSDSCIAEAIESLMSCCRREQARDVKWKKQDGPSIDYKKLLEGSPPKLRN